jgi:hypothetical protein
MYQELSERVRREMAEYKEKYIVPLHKEFQIKSLLKLQEEYDSICSGSNTTMTRKSLLDMIERLLHDMDLKEKLPNDLYVTFNRMKYQIEMTNGMYKYILPLGMEETYNGCNVIASCRLIKAPEFIREIAKKCNATIRIDVKDSKENEDLYNQLIEMKDLRVMKIYPESYSMFIYGIDE